ncbi:MAG: response regulator [Actinomycetia bacterium]|nr:response regulator [Actinomycetes bacterium]
MKKENNDITKSQMLDALMNNIPDSIYFKDKNSKFIKINEACAKKFKINNPNEAAGKNDFDFFSEEHAEKAFQDEQNIIKSGESIVDIEEKETWEDREDKWTSTTKMCLHNERGKIIGTFGISRDITYKKKAEEKLKIAKIDAENYARKAEEANLTKSEFLSNMSHEIRTPMNSILGFSELLDSLIDDPGQRKYLKSIRSSGKILLDLINDILDLSKIEAGKIELKPRPVNPESIFNDIGKIFSVKIREKGLNFLIEIDEELPEALQIDEVRIRQILFNLVGNAVKFTEKGYIKLTVKGIFREQRSKFDLIFLVKDTGVGISTENKGIIFEAFRQSKGQRDEKYGGTGLGLAITKKLVEAMGGKISVDSTVGKGSTFEVILNKVAVASVDDISEDLEETPIDNVKFKKQTVLVVDDIESNRILLEETLKPYNLSTIEAKNGKEGIDAAQKYHPDLIIMDLRMPVMDGYEAIRKIKKDSNLKDIPVIILTASAMKEQEEKIKKINCEGYLRKPIKRTELMRALAIHLDHTKPVPVGEKKAAENKEHKDAPETLTEETKKKIPELISVLESYIKEKWEEVTKTSIINDIEDFAKEIEELGRKYELEILLKWGEKISSQAESFDMGKLPKTLKHFTELVDEIKKLTK